jgi:hypothetical protein
MIARGEALCSPALLYPDVPLRHFARWPALLIRNRGQATAIEGVLTEDVELACFREQRHA